MPMRRKTVAISVISLALCLTLFGCTGSQTKAVIDEINQLPELSEIDVNSREALDSANANYDSLSDKQKQNVSNYSTLEEANAKLADVLYSEITKELETTAELEEDYFAQYYDMNGMTSAKEAAQSAIDLSDEPNYSEVYSALHSENDAFKSYLEEKKATSYSVQTNSGEYPFSLDSSEIQYSLCFSPLMKRSSDYPYDVVFIEGETTDVPPVMSFNVKNSSCVYGVEFKQVDTRSIEVQDENGELQETLVNTEVVLSDPPLSWGTGMHDLYPLGEGSCYLFKSRDSGLPMIAIEDVVEGKGYIVFSFNW